MQARDYRLVIKVQAAQKRDKRQARGDDKHPVPGLRCRIINLQDRQQCGQQCGSGQKAELTVDVPQCAGIRHVAIGDVEKCTALGGAAAQAAAGAHQDKGENQRRH